jgi:23S rRNA pseudouridine1911/1915/1917 synthase
MAHIGHPIVGDYTYGGHMISKREITGKKGDGEDPLIERQALHAWRLQFVHPLKFHRMHLEAKPPADMVTIAELLRKHRK